MGKVNLFQILNIINMAMAVVEKIKGTAGKDEKVKTAIDLAGPFVMGLEAQLGKDLLNEADIKPLVESYITAAKTLVNGIDKFKNLTHVPTGSTPSNPVPGSGPIPHTTAPVR